MADSAARFKFRRQFIMGRSVSPPFRGWQHLVFGDFHVHAHPDLLVTSHESGNRHVILLGYIFDPVKPTRSNDDIISELAQAGTFVTVLDLLAACGGTYVLLYRNEEEMCVVHDAAALAEVYYTTDDDLVVGSQPAILARYTRLEKDSSPAADEFFHSDAFRQSGYLWACSPTLYRNVRHLMPNYYLDLDSGSAVRYWPASRRVKKAMGPVADTAAAWIRGFVEAAIRRYRISIGISAGWDTRVLMAASRPFKDSIQYFIIPHPKGGSIDRADRRIAPRLAARLGVPLAVRSYGDAVDPSFEKDFEESISLGRKSHMAEWYDAFHRLSREEMTINGNVSEIVRLHYERNSDPSGEDLSRLTYGTVLPFAVRAYEAWIDEVKPLCERYDYDVMDLFYWEERMGNWAAKGRSEMHLVTDVFTPYDCRRLLELLLSVDAVHRARFDNELYREIIRRLWPEGLEEPINPRLKLFLSKWMRKLRIYNPLMKAASKLGQ